MSNIVEIKVPDIGDFDAVEVIEVLVKTGDTIAAEQSLITVESDKASMEIPASEGGVVKSLKVKVGDKVSQGSVILEIEAEGAAPAASAPVAEAAVAAPAAAPVTVASAPTAPAVSGGTQSVVVPDIGDFDAVEVIEVLVKVGDTIAAEQSLITVESDKASMEIPASVGGVVKALKVKVGDKVSQGTEILVVETSGAAPAVASAAPAAVAPAAPAPAPVPVVAPHPEAGAPVSVAATRTSPTAAYAESAVPLRDLPHASPSVRKFARELGVNLTRVTGSGPKSRITSDDVRAFVKQSLATGAAGTAGTVSAGEGFSVLGWPKIDFAKFGEIEARPLSRIKKISGANLHRNWVMIPHVTNNEVADITELEALRQQLNAENKKSGGPKVTMLAFLIKAVVAALKKFPEFNASLDGDNLVYKHYYHVGFAADTPNGLVVPVIRNADQKGVLELAAETSALAGVAREGKLSPSQMQGGCFSISSLGGIGGTDFTPIINAPEVAILGVSRSAMQPVWDGKAFQPRLMLPLSLSYDHRVIDGASAARFNAYLAGLLADFRRIIL
ncbi:MAG TPA: dihydrolipoyllysine-residue acetyltransferase [Castellaniella sp.]|uniref:dihydrolipoyllysine-residue acetyltransferase n=1 Tax=Castellaniella sp. TaxID=1955812 RepID=UPI002F008365